LTQLRDDQFHHFGVGLVRRGFVVLAHGTTCDLDVAQLAPDELAALRLAHGLVVGRLAQLLGSLVCHIELCIL